MQPTHHPLACAAQQGRTVGGAVLARWWFWWLALALVLAPALGQMHRTAHGGPAHSAHLAYKAHRADMSHSAPEGHLSVVAALFSGHQPVDCQLLDQLTLGDAPRSSLALAHAPPQATPVAGLRAYFSARRTAAFQARAPPQARCT